MHREDIKNLQTKVIGHIEAFYQSEAKQERGSRGLIVYFRISIVPFNNYSFGSFQRLLQYWKQYYVVKGEYIL